MAWQQAFGHGARVFGLAFHPHSPGVIASASEDETVRVWSRDGSSGAWQQTSCCRGHTSEVLRVAWSPDGGLLASGSADHTVRFWSVSTSTTQHSYTGTELAALSGHPEEVYAVHFLPDAPQTPQQQQQVRDATAQLASSNLDTNQPPAAAAAGAANSSSSSGSGSSSARLLLTASGESLYLWDLVAGQLLQQSAPLPRLIASSAFAAAVAGHHAQRQQEQQPAAPPDAQSPGSSTTSGLDPSSSAQTAPSGAHPEAGDSSVEEGSEESAAAPSYIFGLALCPETHWAAATCSDGMLRLWDASRQALTEVAAVQVHPGQMGSTVAWLPQQPLCVSSISKQGQLVLQDVRLLGRPLLQQQLQGPVYDAVWMAAGPSSSSSGSSALGAAGPPGGVQELQLVVAGRDNCLRLYCLDTPALQQGRLGPPQVVATPNSYSGSLLALATSADRRQLAAAGEAVQADTLQTTQPAQQQQSQQQQQAPAGAGRKAAGVRRGRGRSRAGGARLFSAAAGAADAAMTPSQHPTAAATPAASIQQPGVAPGFGAVPESAAAGSSDMFGDITIAAPAAAGQSSRGHTGAANCAAAAAAGVLTRAPLFVWST